MTSSLKQKRTPWIDVAKGITILTVFLGHTASCPNEIIRAIYFFHMPAFFFLSGYCFKLKNGFGDFVIKKAKGILLPVFTLGLTGSVVVSLMLTFLKNESVEWKWVFLNPVIQYGDHDLLWYLPAAFVSLVCFNRIVKWCKENVKLIMLVSFAVGLFAYLFVKFVKIELPWQIDTACVALPFLAVGYFAKKKDLASKTGNIAVLIISAVICIATGVLNMEFFGVVEMHANSYGNIFLFYLSALAGVCMVVSVSVMISENRMLEFFGRNTLIFYALEPIQYFANFALGLCAGFIPYYDLYATRIIVSLIAVCFVAALSSMAAIIINKYFPFLIGQRREKI